jgi:hypothetical protein
MHLLAGEGNSRTVIGRKAVKRPQDKPTMWLNLYSQSGDNYKKHIVIHEFGHALGLCHEHQRSNFWSLVEPYINVTKMKRELGLSETSFATNWGASQFSGGLDVQYDPLSIMHSW